MKFELEFLTRACGDTSAEDGLKIDAVLEPLSGPGSPVKPAIYEGGRYQTDRRWACAEDDESTKVVVIDNVPSQANRLEDALRRNRNTISNPELVLNLACCEGLPVHLPRMISSLQFPHRNADAYLRDSLLGGEDFEKTYLGKSILAATPWNCGALMSWFPQSLLYGFWQSHLGGIQTKHARAWVSEIVGWGPAKSDTRTVGLKGDPLNLSIDEKIRFNPKDQIGWTFAGGPRVAGIKNGKLSEIGHGQVPFMKDSDASPAAVSFARITQRSTLSLAQLRRVSLSAPNGTTDDQLAEQNAAMRALLVSLGLHAHFLAFGSGFALRSGAELRPRNRTVTWLGECEDHVLEISGVEETSALLDLALKQARYVRVPLDGWNTGPKMLQPKDALKRVIDKAWPVR